MATTSELTGCGSMSLQLLVRSSEGRSRAVEGVKEVESAGMVEVAGVEHCRQHKMSPEYNNLLNRWKVLVGELVVFRSSERVVSEVRFVRVEITPGCVAIRCKNWQKWTTEW